MASVRSNDSVLSKQAWCFANHWRSIFTAILFGCWHDFAIFCRQVMKVIWGARDRGWMRKPPVRKRQTTQLAVLAHQSHPSMQKFFSWMMYQTPSAKRSTWRIANAHSLCLYGCWLWARPKVWTTFYTIYSSCRARLSCFRSETLLQQFPHEIGVSSPWLVSCLRQWLWVQGKIAIFQLFTVVRAGLYMKSV